MGELLLLGKLGHPRQQIGANYRMEITEWNYQRDCDPNSVSYLQPFTYLSG